MMFTPFEVSAPGLRRLFAGCATAALLAVSGLMHAQSKAPAVVTSLVDNNARVTLSGGTPPLVRLSRDGGSLPDSTPANRMLLVLKRSAAQQLQLDQTLAELQNPASPSYHHWLTPAAFGAAFGPADADIQAASAWLTSQGFTINSLSKGHSAIEFSGTAGQVRSAFKTEIHNYTAPSGLSFHANTSDPQIPAALAPLIAGVAALNNIPAKVYSHVVAQVKYDSKSHTGTPLSTGDWSYPVDPSGTYLITAPGDLAVQYDINPIYTAGNKGDGEIIGIVSQAGVDNSMVTNYRKLFGLPTTNLPKEIIDGFDPGIDGDGAGVEANLDVDVAGSTAPNASLYVYTAYDTTISSGLFNAAIRAVDDNASDVISMSYGICEPTLGLAGNLLFNQIWAQASAQGQTVIVSSGDSGSAGCDNGQSSASHGLAVNGITSTPYNLSVGGTDFYYGAYGASGIATALKTYWNTASTAAPTTSLLKVIPEQPWNDAFGFNAGSPFTTGTTAAGSGGPSNCVTGVSAPPTPFSPYDSFTSCSTGTPKPAWQSAPGVPKDGVRDIPDISLFAANGDNYSFYPICAEPGDCSASTVDPVTGAMQITGVGGTSASAPLMAGIMALIDQSRAGRQGNINPVLYSLANSTPSVFHDVTIGNNNVNCTQGTLNCALDSGGFYSYSKYSAGVGYDLASGLGSIDANALLTNWSKATFATTTTSLAASSASFGHGTSITLTSVVSATSGTPTGVVSLVATSTASPQTSYGTMALTNGTARAVFNSLPAGTYQLYAKYGGDATYAASVSDPVTMTVTPENSTVTVSGVFYGVTSTGDQPPVATITNNMTTLYGSFFFIDAKVFGASASAASPDGLPTGTITVLDNGQPFTVLNLSDGFVELQAGSFPVGAHSLTFSYSGDGSFNAGVSAPLNITITKGIPQVLLSYDVPDSLPAGGTFIIPVEVTTAAGQLPLTGSITVTLGSQTQTITNLQQSSFGGLSSIGYGSVTLNGMTPGSYTLDASYSGDSNLAPVAHAYNPLPLTILTSSLASAVTTLTMSANTLGPQGSLTAMVKVTGKAGHIPSGFVSLFEDGNFVSILNTLDATGTIVIPINTASILSNGNAIFQAEYLGDNYNTPGLSNLQTVAVNLGEFSFSSSQQALSMAAGSSSSAMVAVGIPYGLQMTGAVALSCAVSSPVLGCSFASSSLTLPTNPNALASTTLTITSQAGTQAALRPASHPDRPDVLFAALGGSGSLLALCMFMLPGRRKRIPVLLSILTLGAMLMPMMGCSSHTYTVVNQPPVNTASSNAGSYTATVTAVSSGITKTLLIRVVLK